jgi:hypothetical protein
MLRSPLLPDAFYSKLKSELNLVLSENARGSIHAGIYTALIFREFMQPDRGGKRRTEWEDIAATARRLEVLVERTVSPTHLRIWSNSGEINRAPPDVEEFLEDVNSDQVYRLFMGLLRRVKDGANSMLEGRGRPGARRREDHLILCDAVATALRATAGWSKGNYDAKIVKRFAGLLFPHLPPEVAHKSAASFAHALIQALKGKCTVNLAKYILRL